MTASHALRLKFLNQTTAEDCRHADIGTQIHMRPMLLDHADRQKNNGIRFDSAFYFLPGHIHHGSCKNGQIRLRSEYKR